MPLASARFRSLLDASAALVGLPSWTWARYTFAPGEWLEGLVLTESGGDPKAQRYEPLHDRSERSDAKEDGDRPGQDDGVLEDDRSYGLMQILGSNIRRLCGVAPGTPMDFGFALLPLTNVSLGLRVLTGELNTVGGDVSRALARYNGGRTGDVKGPDGRMRRQEYVERVAMNAAIARADRGRARSNGGVES